jgi:hypothetical protein
MTWRCFDLVNTSNFIHGTSRMAFCEHVHETCVDCLCLQVTSCKLVDRHQYFGVTCCLHLQIVKSEIDEEVLGRINCLLSFDMTRHRPKASW